MGQGLSESTVVSVDSKYLEQRGYALLEWQDILLKITIQQHTDLGSQARRLNRLIQGWQIITRWVFMRRTIKRGFNAILSNVLLTVDDAQCVFIQNSDCHVISNLLTFIKFHSSTQCFVGSWLILPPYSIWLAFFYLPVLISLSMLSVQPRSCVQQDNLSSNIWSYNPHIFCTLPKLKFPS